MNYKILSVGHDAKTIKGERIGVLTGVAYLSPHKLSGRNLCPHASPGCSASCLNTAGRGHFVETQQSRLRKTMWFLEDQESFMTRLFDDIIILLRGAHRRDMIACVRLNGTTDIPWENIKLKGESPMDAFPWAIFNDYTKHPIRMRHFIDGKMPPNYHLTFSRSEKNEPEVMRVLKAGGNCTVVFRGGLPESWNGYRVIDGDTHDARFKDPRNVVVGLKAKGKAIRDNSGFVVDVCAKPCVTNVKML